MEHGRRYHAYKDGSYLYRRPFGPCDFGLHSDSVPNDEKQNEQLDIGFINFFPAIELD